MVFLADHGEAFGENGEVGHGRTLHDPTLRVPLGFVWSGRLLPGEASLDVSLLDVAPTVLGLLGLPRHPFFRGTDLTPATAGGTVALPPVCLQAHRGAVQSVRRAERARRAGLLEVGVLDGGKIESLRLARPARDEIAPAGSAALEACRAEIRAGLAEADRLAPPELDAESAAELRALGYLD